MQGSVFTLLELSAFTSQDRCQLLGHNNARRLCVDFVGSAMFVKAQKISTRTSIVVGRRQ